MKKIALYRGKTIDCDIFKPTDYTSFYENYSVSGGNVGNKLFNTATEKYITNSYTKYEYFLYDEVNFIPFIKDNAAEEINGNFDLVLMPQANIFGNSDFHKKLLSMWSIGISKIKIPVIVLGVGIQAKTERDLKVLAESISKEAGNFIESVYKTGGTISLRGNYTKQFFDYLGYTNYCVTGCPSIFQRGKNFCIQKKSVRQENFKPIINGFHSLFYKKCFSQLFSAYKSSVYIDQDESARIFYDKNYFTSGKPKDFLGNKSITELKLMSEKRYHLFYDLKTRFDFLINNEFNFSFGPRIHGNIMSILNNIPGFVYAIDLRTLELADLFCIPYAENITTIDLFEQLENWNYNKFNKNYTMLYKNFENFLLKNNVIEKDLDSEFIKFDSRFDSIQWIFPEIVNQVQIENMYAKIEKHYALYNFLDKSYYAYSKIKQNLGRR